MPSPDEVFRPSDRAAIERYFREFNQAFRAYLRPYKDKFSPLWLGVAHEKRTLEIVFTSDGFAATVGETWLGIDTITRTVPRLELALASKWKVPDAEEYHIDFWAHPFAGDAGEVKLATSGSPPTVSIVPYGSGTSILIVAPKVHVVRNGKVQPPSKPPWIVRIASRRTGLSALDGLDPDPHISAQAFAGTVLYEVGVYTEPPVERYGNALDALRRGVAEQSPTNERALHEVIERYPWILLDEVDYRNFSSKQRFRYTESVLDGAQLRDEERTIEPDFVYERHDGVSLVVEIEAATKRLQIARTETTYQLAAQATSAATFQIENYSKIFDGIFGREIRRQLQKPDSWLFEFLLVVGSKLQADFDERSWSRQRERAATSRVKLQNWDHYLDRLERLKQASTFKPLPGS